MFSNRCCIDYVKFFWESPGHFWVLTDQFHLQHPSLISWVSMLNHLSQGWGEGAQASHVAGTNGSTHLRWTGLAHSNLDRLAEEGPFNLSMASPSVGNNSDDSGDECVWYLAAYKAKRTPPSAHTILTMTLAGRGYYYYAHFTDRESKALRSDLPKTAWSMCNISSPSAQLIKL